MPQSRLVVEAIKWLEQVPPWRIQRRDSRIRLSIANKNRQIRRTLTEYWQPISFVRKDERSGVSCTQPHALNYSHRFDTRLTRRSEVFTRLPAKHSLPGSSPPIRPARWGTFKMCLPVQRRRITSSVCKHKLRYNLIGALQCNGST